tara:strand:- start:69 stop:851 length:783 start_codon:yes stop_codon:yes gene_type:complete
MKTSLIISTYNWPEALELVLKSVLFQVISVNEIIIADDGSTNKTCELIEKYISLFDVPLIHIWHEDKGFRKTTILNKAYKAASGDYIVQIDGDIILHPSFIKDHINNAEKGTFIHGGRVLLDADITLIRLKNANIKFHFFNRGLVNRINTIYFPFLSGFFNYRSSTLSKTRGCNFACWKKDFALVNGYNEKMIGWGLEDTELSARLINNGIFKKRLKFIALSYHLFHKSHQADNYTTNQKILRDTISSKVTFCDKGLNQY